MLVPWLLWLNVGADIPHDEGNPETPDYQFVKWMTRNKVWLQFAALKLIENCTIKMTTCRVKLIFHLTGTQHMIKLQKLIVATHLTITDMFQEMLALFSVFCVNVNRSFTVVFTWKYKHLQTCEKWPVTFRIRMSGAWSQNVLFVTAVQLYGSNFWVKNSPIICLPVRTYSIFRGFRSYQNRNVFSYCLKVL